MIDSIIIALADHLNEEVDHVERMEGGGNSRVYRVMCVGGKCYVAKFYHQTGSDPRDRLMTEFNALRFLWRNGIRRIPQPILADAARGYCLYEYIRGTPVNGSRIGESDIDAAIGFIINLDGLRFQTDAAELPAASEACFSLEALIGSIQGRLDRLAATPENEPMVEDLSLFLSKEVAPFFSLIKMWSKDRAMEWGWSIQDEIHEEERTLSPSDFGFHNALREEGGSIRFYDFEYFGWDDPAKLIVDFVLHPAMDIDDHLSRRFVKKAMEHFGKRGSLAVRLGVVYPLYGIKWCAILLNEFVGSQLERRRFAQGLLASSEDVIRLRRRQMNRARDMLRRVENNYEGWPSFD